MPTDDHNQNPVPFDALSEEEKRNALLLLSRGKLSEEEKRVFAESCRSSTSLTDTEKKRIKQAFALSSMTEEERKDFFARRHASAPRQDGTPESSEGGIRQTASEQPPQNDAERREEQTAPREGVHPNPSVQSDASSASGRTSSTERQATPEEIRKNAVVDLHKGRDERKQRQKKDRKEAKETYESDSGSTTVTSLLKGIVYIVAVLVISAFLSWSIITIGNDIYAFVKSDATVKVVITEDMTVKDVAQMLYENGVIKFPTVYELYIRIKNRNTNYLVGEYEVSPSMNYKQLNNTFTYVESTRQQVIITIPEGYTVDQIIDLFLSYGIGTREGFVDAINNYPFEGYRFLDELSATTLDPQRKYRLEGYLFPDTYYFFSDSTEAAVIYKMLDNFQRKVTDAHYDRAKTLGYTMDQIITLASMIQGEGSTLSDFENISSVFHNRLDHASIYPKLQSDATLQYVMKNRTADITAEDLVIDSKYNTYLYDGLPPSAVCNPSLDAIDCALYPAETKYYYFIADRSGVTHFSETLQEHEALRKEFYGSDS
ncbi:MAG: endolytic transglycosylase MltG [Clostridia bacterium]|nr:endolytic transglycosylase MltG [Clostridia bacterium]MBO4797396.1 endolytic transglycosylase MltG [Candidatus Methanomethylophilaceae archaeon]MBQ4290148.1 endolytic transglycosylase MltG [Clostridia bacterium]